MTKPRDMCLWLSEKGILICKHFKNIQLEHITYNIKRMYLKKDALYGAYQHNIKLLLHGTYKRL